MTNDESLRTLSKIDAVFDAEDRTPPEAVYPVSTSSNYEPVRMGALKASEIETHKQGIKDMTPFANTGPARPTNFLRDDDPYYRATGVKCIGGVVPRTLRKLADGPQAAARQTVSTTEEDIRAVHWSAAHAPYENY